MEERTLKWLELNEMRVLKQIIIISDRKYGETELGSIIYTRPLTEDYSLKEQKVVNEKRADTLLRLIQDHAKQNYYPNDRIDEIILDAITRIYPKSIVRNDTILFNVDLEKIDVLKNRMVIPSTIYFSPEFSNANNFKEYVGQKFKAPKVDVNVYSFYKPEFMEGHIFYATYNVSEEYVLNSLETVKFE